MFRLREVEEIFHYLIQNVEKIPLRTLIDFSISFEFHITVQDANSKIVYFQVLPSLIETCYLVDLIGADGQGQGYGKVWDQSTTAYCEIMISLYEGLFV